MQTAKIELTTRSGPLGANPQARHLTAETVIVGGMPTAHFAALIREAVAEAIKTAGAGGVTEVRILAIPGSLSVIPAGRG